MSASQILVEVVVGLLLLVIGVFVRGPLERFHEFVKRPTPLTPQTRGQWVTYLATMEQSLARINYLNAHPRDLYLYLFQLVFASMALDGLAFILVVFIYATPANPQQRELLLALSVVTLTFGIVLATIGVVEGNRLSQKRIEATRSKLQKQIDKTKRLLDESPSSN